MSRHLQDLSVIDASPDSAATSSGAPASLSPPLANLSVRGAQAPALIESRPMRDRVSEAEWQMRIDLAACYRLMHVYGMTDMIYNHITARVPGEPDHFLINAYGFHYSEITASNLHKVNHAGDIVLRADTHYGINHAGYLIHSAVHASRPDVICAIHSHTRAGVAVAAMECGLLPISLTAMRFMNHIAYHDFEGTVVHEDEQARLVEHLGVHNAMILRNHGLLTCAPTIAQAFNNHYVLNLACQIQVDAMASGASLLTPAQQIIDETSWLFRPEVRRPYGDMEWEAMLRLLDRQDPSYRT